MKKIIVALVGISFLIILYTLFPGIDSHVNHESSDESREAVKQSEGGEEVGSEETSTGDKNSQEEKETTNKDTNPENSELSCYQRYSAKPEWEKVQKIQQEIFIDISYLDPDGNAYTNLPVESLKAFADSGDRDAMIFYGVELMQTAALGLSSMKRAELERQHRMDEAKQKREAYEPDLEQFNEGVEYIHRAAAQGKFAAFVEVQLYFRLLAYQMSERSWKEEKINDALATSYAYELLQKDILRKNKLFVKMMSQRDSLKRALKRIYPEKETLDELMTPIQDKGRQKFEEKKNEWNQVRAMQGLKVYPDLFGKELKSFTQTMAENCYPN
ncbi:hypothetical protein [Kangiella shandongensis]|uniref:hypothetical protein n=1 Tax=Kangiella shandongensis TaxID=2763258 RepID=UPI001CBF84D3|nr:hypothetical protein [Kangiella shandongensis]